MATADHSGMTADHSGMTADHSGMAADRGGREPRTMNPGAIVTLLSMCCFVLGCSQQYLLGVPDQVAASCGVGLSEVSALVTSFALCNAIGSPLVVVASGRKSRTIQLCIALAFMVVGLAMMAVSSSYPVLVAARGICGVGYGTFVAQASAVAADVAPEGKSGSYMSRVALGFSAATVLALPIARMLHDVIDWHVAYGVLAVCAVIALVLVYRMLPHGEASDAAGAGGADASGAGAAGAGSGGAGGSDADSDGAGATGSLRDRLSPLSDRRIVLALCVTCLIISSYGTAYTYITPYIEAVMPGLSAAGASAALLAIGLCSLVGTKLCGWLSDAVGVRPTLLGGLTVEAVTLAACGLFPGLGVGALVLLCVWTAAAWMYVPAQNLVLARLAGRNATMALALANSFFQLGYAIGSAVAGACIVPLGVTALPGVAAAFAVAALAAEVVLFRKAPEAAHE
jgi:DHA1 family putative efflux transporter-like MFS transporter